MSRYLEGTLNVFNLPYLTCPFARYSESVPIDTANNVFTNKSDICDDRVNYLTCFSI